MDRLRRQIHEAEFTNSFVDELPGEESGSKLPRQVPGACYSRVSPTPVADPRLLAWSRDLGDYLGLEQPAERGPSVDVLGGNLVTPSMKPYAARYGGHQFGSWAGQLGDGRAITLGEVEATDGSRWEIQLKGAGMTPYSRHADGRAVLRSSLREFLCSEAMHWLGVPTTRALSLVATGDTVIRDMFYMGDPRPEPGAITARVAPTFIRFGNFEIMTAREELENLRLLADYVLRHFYPELGEPSEESYVAWFTEVSRRTAVMIAHWMTVGFVHGVMNTDNMSILGVTIDYGPYGWMEPYEPGWTPNTTDFATHRYAFGQQPQIALWNLWMLARALTPLVSDVAGLEAGLETYRSTLAETHRAMLLRKLGLQPTTVETDDALLEALEAGLVAAGVDMTLFFRTLSHAAPAALADPGAQQAELERVLEASAYPESPGGPDRLREWLRGYTERLRSEGRSPESVREGMLAANPKYVLRNYLAQNAIDAATAGDLAPLHRLLEVLRRPFDEQPEHDDLAARRPEWARTKPGCATLSCSS
ncbi:MAG: protein adenylyltransferase SelO [Armatimonadota bacterium]